MSLKTPYIIAIATVATLAGMEKLSIFKLLLYFVRYSVVYTKRDADNLQRIEHLDWNRSMSRLNDIDWIWHRLKYVSMIPSHTPILKEV